ncbi:hypothetical protein J9317_12745 [Metabacillus sp. KIGAM252]|uniref:Signal peptidase I n=1 Tax=Metabacillus flavus TaxID=2823519 RepID=A0ABS5LGZ2_9BACI|nr:hypothetical protein [Metabacillus flavus]MBS2969634.1 hypothetical protein [Metabacillus flavus]
MPGNSAEEAVIRQYLKKHGRVDLPASGTSMFPYIRQGEICRFEKIDPFELKAGEVALFVSSEGKLIAHRFLKKEKHSLIFKGDTNLGEDAPVLKDQVIAKLIEIHRGKKAKKSSFFWTIIWPAVVLGWPCIPLVLRKYLNYKRK